MGQALPYSQQLVDVGHPHEAPGLGLLGLAPQGATPNSTASDRLVVWLEVESGSRYQSWAWTVAPGPGCWRASDSFDYSLDIR